jgi:hypothetical protein
LKWGKYIQGYYISENRRKGIAIQAEEELNGDGKVPPILQSEFVY